MPEFLYKARDEAGVVVEGVVEAVSMGEASTTLADRSLNVIALVPREKRRVYELPLKAFGRIKNKDIVIFSRQLSVLVSANVAIVQSLRTVQHQTGNPKLRMVVGEVANDVEAGTRLSIALSRHTNAFSPFYVNMVRSGETSGRIDEVLAYLADQLEKDYDLLSRVKGSMYYPAFIICGMFIAGFIMMTFVVPRLTSVLLESGATLPLPTRILMAVSNFFNHYWLLLILGIVGSISVLVWWVRTETGARLWGTFSIRIPVFGGIFQRVAIVRILRSVRTLLEGGVDAVVALEVSADVSGNAAFHDLMMDAAKEVRDGRPISTVFADSPDVMPAMVTQMIAVGEETGKLSEILERLAQFYTREVDNLIGGLVTLIEPIVIVIIGIGVGVMVSAIILPMYNLSQTF